MSRPPLELQIFEVADFKKLLPKASKQFTGYCRETVIRQIEREKPSEASLYDNIRVKNGERDILHGIDARILFFIPGAEQRVREYNINNWLKAQNIIMDLTFTNLTRFYTDFKKYGLTKCVEMWNDITEGVPS